MNGSKEKHRKRRIASDEAHAWARSVPLNNPYGKTVLRALTLYVNGEGCCFVGLDQLAEDTDLSVDTVRRRLVWLDRVGAIVRMHQWHDANGRRNSEGRGKRTTDEIRLLIDADLDEIERRARGDMDDETEAADPKISPSTENEAQKAENSVSSRLAPPLALRQPSQSCDPLISEPEPELESSPKPPSGAVPESDGFEEFEKVWLEPMTRPSLARQVWSGLTATERPIACQAAQGYFQFRKAQAKPPHPIAAQTFLREREAWPKFAEMAQKKTAIEGVWIAEGSDEDLALRFARGLCKMPNPFVRNHPGGNGPPGYPHPSLVGLDLLALLVFVDQSPFRWPMIEPGTAEFAKWRTSVYAWVGGELKPWRIGETWVRVPCRWVPSKQGIIYDDGDSSSIAS